jgi:hypothetical protein
METKILSKEEFEALPQEERINLIMDLLNEQVELEQQLIKLLSELVIEKNMTLKQAFEIIDKHRDLYKTMYNEDEELIKKAANAMKLQLTEKIVDHCKNTTD